MKKIFLRSTATYILFFVTVTLLFSGCSKKVNPRDIQELDKEIATHTWYYLTEYSFEQIDLPQHSPSVLKKPWTEAVRISAAACVPGNSSGEYSAYAIVNRTGILAFTEKNASLFCDSSIFSEETADGLVFSENRPVFYLYRSTFFNEGLLKSDSISFMQAPSVTSVEQSRSFLVQFNPMSKLCFPLVSYSNLNLNENDQITGYFWNGKTWACSAKTLNDDHVESSYFCWEPSVSLTSLTPALNANQFTFSELNENKYRALHTPLLFRDAPSELKKLLSSIPDSFPFFITWRDSSGTSPISFYQEGNGETPVNANAQLCDSAGFTAALFSDGTTYLMQNETGKITAFRLPKLPEGFSYSELALAGNTLYVSWEEKSFYQTGKAGFLQVNLKGVLEKTK